MTNIDVINALNLHVLLTRELDHLNATAPTDRPLTEDEVDERIVRMSQLIDVSEYLLHEDYKTEKAQL